MKKMLILFGTLDLATLGVSHQHAIWIASQLNQPTSALVGVVNAANLLLYLSLLASAYFLIAQNRIGLWLTYVQFPGRLLFLVLSLGFILKVASPMFNLGLASYEIFLWALVGLEFVRLGLTVMIHRKHFR